MARKRFNATERGILSRGRGTPVEWQNVTRWHPGTLTGEGIHHGDGGWQHSYAITHEDAGFVRKGERIHVTPGHIRVPAQR
jgi:hypothetical protein